ncbi:MAG: DNA repair protein RecO, partial [Parcubacteria group bacterium]
MSYHIYTTRAFVLSSHPRREADRIYALLTEDLGLLYATAGGVRKIESKLRGSLEPYSLSLVSLVKGEEHWRITSASLIRSLPLDLSKEKLLLFARASLLIKKLIPEEQAHKEIYRIIEKSAESVTNGEAETEAMEIVMLLEILSELGYVPKDKVPTVEEAKENRIGFINSINSALKETHLA